MDNAKRNQLIAELQNRSSADHVVDIQRFFDGNDDAASIGCNLLEHPGMDTYRDVLARVAARPDVDSVWARVAELEPGEDSWPFTDTVFVVGTIPPEDLEELVAPLEPDEIGFAAGFDVPPSLQRYPDDQLLVLWWD